MAGGCWLDMSTNHILELILEELKHVQESAEKLQAQAQNETGGDASAKASEHIQAAVKKMQNLISEYELLHQDKPA